MVKPQAPRPKPVAPGSNLRKITPRGRKIALTSVFFDHHGWPQYEKLRFRGYVCLGGENFARPAR